MEIQRENLAVFKVTAWQLNLLNHVSSVAVGDVVMKKSRI